MPWLTRLDQLELRLLDFRLVELGRNLEFRSRKTGRLYIVPRGFVSDLASVPWWLRSLAPPWQQSARAGLLHDYAYRIGAHPAGSIRKITRSEADLLLWEGLRADDVGRIRARAMWAAVRTCGASSWRRKKTSWRPLEFS